jgi:hypothetical protein
MSEPQTAAKAWLSSEEKPATELEPVNVVAVKVLDTSTRSVGFDVAADKVDPPKPRELKRQDTSSDVADVEANLKQRFGDDPRMPKIVQALKAMDQDADGVLSEPEIAEFIIKQLDEQAAGAKQKQKNKKLRLYIVLLLVVVFLMVVANAGLTAGIVFLAKDTKVGSGGAMLTTSGDNVKVSSADTVVAASGAMLDNKGHHVKVSEAVDELPTMDSRLPDHVWKELKYLYFKAAGGGSIHLLVQAWTRVPASTALFGSYIHIHTNVGDVWFDADVPSFHDGMQHMFNEAGFNVVKPNSKDNKYRRLQVGSFELLGLFNSVPSFTGWNSSYHAPPKIPTTYTAKMVLMYACNMQNDDFCDSRMIPAAQRTVWQGENWTTTVVEEWADSVQGAVRERFSSMPNADGWALERVTRTMAGVSTQQAAQIWNGTGEHFFCREKEVTLLSAVIQAC